MGPAALGSRSTGREPESLQQCAGLRAAPARDRRYEGSGASERTCLEVRVLLGQDALNLSSHLRRIFCGGDPDDVPLDGEVLVDGYVPKPCNVGLLDLRMCSGEALWKSGRSFTDYD